MRNDYAYRYDETNEASTGNFKNKLFGLFGSKKQSDEVSREREKAYEVYSGYSAWFGAAETASSAFFVVIPYLLLPCLIVYSLYASTGLFVIDGYYGAHSGAWVMGLNVFGGITSLLLAFFGILLVASLFFGGIAFRGAQLIAKSPMLVSILAFLTYPVVLAAAYIAVSVFGGILIYNAWDGIDWFNMVDIITKTSDVATKKPLIWH